MQGENIQTQGLLIFALGSLDSGVKVRHGGGVDMATDREGGGGGITESRQRKGGHFLIIGKRVNHGKLYGAAAGKEEGQRRMGDGGWGEAMGGGYVMGCKKIATWIRRNSSWAPALLRGCCFASARLVFLCHS